MEVPEEVAQSPDNDKVCLVESKNNGRKTHQCKECEKKFVLKSNLKRHLSTVHRKEKDHQCTRCDKKFGHNSHLQRHLATVHLKVYQEVKPHQCPKCNMKFGVKEKLKRHLSYMHGGVKPFTCTEPDCDAKFVENTSLSDHLRSKHSHPKLNCVIEGCGAKFTWRSDYYKHKKIAHGGK